MYRGIRFFPELRSFFGEYFVNYVLYESERGLSFEDWHRYLINAAVYFPERTGETAQAEHSLQEEAVD